jgi:hypothetical protein
MRIEVLTRRAVIARRSADAPVQARIEYLAGIAVTFRTVADAAVLMRIEVLTLRAAIAGPAADAAVLARVVLLPGWTLPRRLRVDATALEQDEHLAGRANRLRLRRLREQRRPSHAKAKADEKPKSRDSPTHYVPSPGPGLVIDPPVLDSRQETGLRGTMGQRRSASKMPKRQKVSASCTFSRTGNG